jgi:hypothetical protein
MATTPPAIPKVVAKKFLVNENNKGTDNYCEEGNTFN